MKTAKTTESKAVHLSPSLRELRAMIADPTKLRRLRAAAKRDGLVLWLRLP